VSDEIAGWEHPAAEKLAAYQGNELPLEESDAIQEHLASCHLCAERLLDLQRFLDFVPEVQGREGVVDLETAAEWRKLRQRVRRKTKKERFFASARGGYSLAAVLLVVSVGLLVWNLNLWQESRRPQPLRTIQTLEAKESFRSAVELVEPVSLPAQITLNLPTETPDPLYRVELFRKGSLHAEESLELPPQGPELRLFLPEKSLTPGTYDLRVRGVRDGKPSLKAWTYELTILPRRP